MQKEKSKVEKNVLSCVVINFGVFQQFPIENFWERKKNTDISCLNKEKSQIFV